MKAEVDKSFYYSQGRLTNGEDGTEQWQDACDGHETMMEAILCHETAIENYAAGRLDGGPSLCHKLLQSLIGRKPAFEVRIVKRTIIVEEVEAAVPLRIKVA